jgi:hypothetical protein
MIKLDETWDIPGTSFDELWDPNNFICEACRQKMKEGEPALCMCYNPARDNRKMF